MAMAIEIASGMPSGIAMISKHRERITYRTVVNIVSFEKSDLSPLKSICKML